MSPKGGGHDPEERIEFVHGNRGRKPATTIPEGRKQLIIELYKTKYYGSNFAHFTEMLTREEGIHLSESAVRSILEASYILSPKATKAKKKRIKKELESRKLQSKSKKRRQSRLPVELRLAGITTREAANDFLIPYIEAFNDKFALPLQNIKSVFELRPTDEKINLLLSVLAERTVDNGHSRLRREAFLLGQ